MKPIKILFILIGLLFVFSCVSTNTNKPEKVPEEQPSFSNELKWNSAVKAGKLDNGMSFYVMKNGEPKNRIYLRLVVKAGSAMEEEDQKGVAHFIEHLAFNGTKNFEKRAIVDYFEKIGMGFGPEVNAYTSFEETVYMLEIPADDPQILKTSLLVLHDWASAVSFDSEEIEKERGVVTEEWRLSQGLNRRITEKQIPLLLKDSQFENRLPIGDMNIIKTIKRERILDFYKKWYRPENMAIVAVGDIDEATLEKAIKEVMNDIPSSSEVIQRPVYDLPVQTKKEIAIIKDKEQKYPVINIYMRKDDFGAIKTKEDVRNSLLNQISASVLNERYETITNNSQSLWLAAQAGEYNMTNKNLFGFLGLVPKDGSFEAALKAFITEYDRFRFFGITESELQRNKQKMLVQEEQYYKNKDKITSETYATSILQYELIGKTVVSEDDYYKLYNEIIPYITLEEINQYISEVYETRGTAMFIIAPDTSKDIPTEAELMEIWENYKADDISAYEEDEINDSLMEKPKKKGRVVSSKEISDFSGKEYVLNNGIRIIAKKTDFQTNMVNMTASSWGGSNYVSEADFPSSQVAVDYAILSGIYGIPYNELMKKVSTKNFGVSASIYADRESINGAATREDLEYLFQFTNLLFTKPQFTNEGWSILMNYVQNQADSYGKQPIDVLLQEIRNIMYKDNIRYSAVTPEFAAKIDQKTAEKIYRERFADPSDFTFVFVGDYDEKALLDLCCTYLGSISTAAKKETAKDIIVPFPKGKITSTVNKGIDKQGTVFLAFGGEISLSNNLKQDYLEMQKLYMLQNLLDIRLREAIREEKGGSYGVSVYAGFEGNNQKKYTVQISFGCEPEREEELVAEVLKQIELLQREKVNEDYLQKISETVKRTYETNYRNNEWIMANILSSAVFKEQPGNFYDLEKDVLSVINGDTLMETAKKYLDTKNYVNVNLKPEL